jgi:hypothetical protein
VAIKCELTTSAHHLAVCALRTPIHAAGLSIALGGSSIRRKRESLHYLEQVASCRRARHCCVHRMNNLAQAGPGSSAVIGARWCTIAVSV